MIHRPSSAHGDGRLVLEFTNRQGVMAIVSSVGAEKAKEESTSDFDRLMRTAINAAVHFAEKNGSAKSDVRQLAEAQPDEMPWSAVRFTIEPDKDSGPKHEKLTDKMQRTARAADSQPIDLRDDVKRPLRSAHELRRMRRSSPTLPSRQLEIPDLWTSKNPGWRQLWKTSLVFPATGKNRTTVDADDIPRLDEGEFLNDNLINFYLRYLQVELENHRPELLKKVHIFSTFFFEKLRSTKGKINYDGVKAWTAKFDLFTYDYIVVPVNECAHWYLAIICNAPNVLSGIPARAADVEVIDMSQDHAGPEVVSSPPSTATRTIETSPNAGGRTWTGGGPQKHDPRQPKIVTLDSLGSQHSPTCRALKEYLAEEAKSKKGVGLAVAPNGMTAKEIPEQDNFCDCGVFVLGYMEEFLKDPDQAARKLLQKESLGWDVQPFKLRDNVRTLLFQLQEIQQARLKREQKEKKMKRRSMAKGKPEDKANVSSSQAAEASSSSPQASAEERTTDAVMELSTKEGENNGRPAEEPSPPKSSGPPKGTLQSCDDEAAFVSSLKSDSSRSANTPNDVFYSAPSSPDGKPPGDGARLAGQSANGKRAGKAQQAGKPASCSKEPQFVATLPSSSPPPDSAAGVEAPKKQRQREPSVELIKGSTGMVSRRESKRSSGPVPSVTRSFLSVEIPSAGSRRAGYDGVDRSADQAVDLT